MKWVHSALIALFISCAAHALSAQTQTTRTDETSSKPIPTKNPLEGDADAIRAGMGQFRSRCADCHGMDARGVRAPDLTQVWASGRTDDGLFKTLKAGVPGTEMPAFGPRMFDQEAWQILAYLRTLASPAPTDAPKGNAD